MAAVGALSSSRIRFLSARAAPREETWSLWTSPKGVNNRYRVRSFSRRNQTISRLLNYEYLHFPMYQDRYDLSRELKLGKPETWYATRYRNRMSPGDVVYLWMAGDEDIRGLCGMGELVRPEKLGAVFDIPEPGRVV